MEENLNEFRPIPGIENYVVNLNNQVKSLERYVTYNTGRVSLIKEKILTNQIDYRKNTNGGHISVRIMINKKGKTMGIHLLVALAWNLPKKQYDTVVKHLDNNPLNNHWRNLKWDTVENNNRDAVRDGLMRKAKGENHYNFKSKINNIK
jgi:hypothetical protein